MVMDSSSDEIVFEKKSNQLASFERVLKLTVIAAIVGIVLYGLGTLFWTGSDAGPIPNKKSLDGIDTNGLPRFFCGNKICEENETKVSCMIDCFACNQDGLCDSLRGETPGACPSDC
ncbi:MAG: hypothetical protein J4215_02960 [Candidatus Diapherotrites archaeon]|uniref:Uncharacterized protein n=1 Tax=Candidatus Iainarchaeum sp. TaxID=3101447 RepID=A0A8T4L4P0_9ARCH|nr:hypothetical protein [Candidatus Diapherotrites archaeon]